MEACKYYDLLELSPDAAIADIHKNYSYPKNLYSGDSIEITALNDDFSQELRQDYLARIDDAYEKPGELLKNNKPTSILRLGRKSVERGCDIPMKPPHVG